MDNHLKRYRESVNMSQRELAYYCNVSRETINRLEKGKHKPSLKLAYDVTKSINRHVTTGIDYEVTDIFPMN